MGCGDIDVRTNTIIMIGMAGVCGVLAIMAGRTWLDQQSEARMRAMQANQKQVKAATIVVAAAPIRFGTEITRQHLREMPWPDGAQPKGAFPSLEAFFAGQVKRVALDAMDENEAVLAAKVTGPGQRASLSAVIGEGMKAITIRVNDVNGVAGFVLPGDRVDILLTRASTEARPGSTDMILQNLRVLGVDQILDEKTDKPIMAKAVTLEANAADAQKLALGSTVGTLSLGLRPAGTLKVEPARRISESDLVSGQPADGLVTATVGTGGSGASIGVTRGTTRQNYSVPAYGN